MVWMFKSPQIHFKIPLPKVMVLEGGDFGRWLDPEDGAFVMELVLLGGEQEATFSTI